MEAALSNHEDVCILNTVLMHEMSGVKQRKHRQKGVSLEKLGQRYANVLLSPEQGRFAPFLILSQCFVDVLLSIAKIFCLLCH